MARILHQLRACLGTIGLCTTGIVMAVVCIPLAFVTPQTNCFLYAYQKYQTQGGYILVTPSKWGWWPHFLWSADLPPTYEAFDPPVKRKRWYPPIVFRGRITRQP